MPNRVSIILCGLALIVLTLPLAATAERTTAKDAAVVKVVFNKKLKKKILVTGSGLTLYLFTADTSATPSCYDDATYHCAVLWPPYRSSETPVAGPGLNASLLTTVNRSDGDPQVMYNRHPLYTDAGSAQWQLKPDVKLGQIRGQGFLGIWYVVSPTGRAIKKIPKK
jgi:predicted lipoprotein with Yx(FWY)xxD motif